MNKRVGRTRVLFVCVGNSCRSAMAEAIALLDAADTIEALSAGLAPIGFVAEMTKQTLMRNGYWVKGLRSKRILPEIWSQADRVINMSGRRRELAFPDYSKVEDWEIEDPFGNDPEIYQQTFEKIRQRVAELAQECRRNLQAARITERRARVRLDLTSLIFIKPDVTNGGIVFNISEDGLAFTAGMALFADDLPTMRIQFPESGNWIKTSGQIVWRSESKKEAGVRFGGLTAEAQQQIRDWISLQVSGAESHPERETSPALSNEQDALGGVDLHAPKSFSLEDAIPPATSEQLIGSINSSTESQTSPDRILDANAELTRPQRQFVDDDSARAESPRSISNRRIHFRKRAIPPSYIDLAKSNGGIVLNVSEGGLNLTAAIELADAHLPSMRFQLPHCSGWIEAKGQVTWKSESGKEAGVRFVELSEETQRQIRTWISSQELPSSAQKQIEKVREAQNLCAAPPILGSRDRGEVVQEDLPAKPFLRDPVSQQEVTVPVIAPRVPKPAGIPPAKGVPKARLARLAAKNRRRNLGVPGRKWRRIATVAGLVVLITVTGGWIARNLGVGNKMVTVATRQTAIPIGATKDETRPVERRTTEAPTPSTEKIGVQAPGNKSFPTEMHQNTRTSPRNLPLQARSVERSSPTSILKHPNRPQERTPAQAHVTKEPNQPQEKAPAPVQVKKEPTLTAANVNSPPVQAAQPQRVGSLPAPPQLEANTASGISSAPVPLKDTSLMEPKKIENTTASPKLPENPANMTALVAIHTDPYPSLRIPSGRSSKKSSQGKSLQFGQLVSRVEPAYPEEAKQRGIQGTVKLHAVIGRDGAVESVSSISGPPLLVPAAMNAVRGWHYSQTLLDKKSVEIEEDISLVFRLSNSAATRN